MAEFDLETDLVVKVSPLSASYDFDRNGLFDINDAAFLFGVYNSYYRFLKTAPFVNNTLDTNNTCFLTISALVLKNCDTRVTQCVHTPALGYDDLTGEQTLVLFYIHSDDVSVAQLFNTSRNSLILGSRVNFSSAASFAGGLILAADIGHGNFIVKTTASLLKSSLEVSVFIITTDSQNRSSMQRTVPFFSPDQSRSHDIYNINLVSLPGVLNTESIAKQVNVNVEFQKNLVNVTDTTCAPSSESTALSSLNIAIIVAVASAVLFAVILIFVRQKKNKASRVIPNSSASNNDPGSLYPYTVIVRADSVLSIDSRANIRTSVSRTLDGKAFLYLPIKEGQFLNRNLPLAAGQQSVEIEYSQSGYLNSDVEVDTLNADFGDVDLDTYDVDGNASPSFDVATIQRLLNDSENSTVCVDDDNALNFGVVDTEDIVLENRIVATSSYGDFDINESHHVDHVLASLEFETLSRVLNDTIHPFAAGQQSVEIEYSQSSYLNSDIKVDNLNADFGDIDLDTYDIDGDASPSFVVATFPRLLNDAENSTVVEDDDAPNFGFVNMFNRTVATSSFGDFDINEPRHVDYDLDFDVTGPPSIFLPEGTFVANNVRIVTDLDLAIGIIENGEMYNVSTDNDENNIEL